MTDSRARVEALGAVTSIGIGIEQISASVRTGTARFADSAVHDRWFSPIRMALLPESALPPLLEPVDARPFTARHRRMLRLATPALRRALVDVESPVPLFLGVHEPESGNTPVNGSAFLGALRDQTQAPLALDESQIFAHGRAATFVALASALQTLATGTVETVLVGGVDTYLDLYLLSTLDAEGRILGERVMDGFIPGEGAAFLLLTTRAPPGQAAAAISAAGVSHDPGHRYCTEPARGEGLTTALASLEAQAVPRQPIATMLAGLNGESFFAKEWGVARLRAQHLYSPDMTFDHPGDCWGDTGAATGALLLALAANDLARGKRSSPALVWASSDRGDCGCALLDLLS